MALTNTNIGAKIIRTIGRAGQRPDENPARIAGAVFSENVNGRTVLKVPVIEVAKNLAGEERLREAVANVFFSFDRSERHELLDGAPDAPKNMAQLMADVAASGLAYLRSLPESGQEVTADDLGI